MMEPKHETQRLVSRAITKLRAISPFFSALALYAKVIETTKLPTAATNGKDLFVNPAYLASLKSKERVGLLLHEVLHAALLHVPRRGPRDALLWNIAADIVVNGVVAKQAGIDLPPRGIREKSLEHLSVEEVYHYLLSNPKYEILIVEFSSQMEDLIDEGAGGALAASHQQELEAHWRNALKQSETLARSTGQGSQPLGMERELGMLNPAKIDWRAHIWRFLVQTPTDFQGFDRRYIGQGYYLEALEGESVAVAVAVDTSGSVSDQILNAFMSEIQGILRSYPHIRCDLYYADARLYGPFSLSPDEAVPPPQGGGGTDFRPFFEEVDRTDQLDRPAACIYLTDGFGAFPKEPPRIPTLWVVLAGGLDLEDIPFGDSVRLLVD